MLRLFRLTGVFFQLNVHEIFMYRASFITGIISVILWMALSLVSISILTYQSPYVGGWSKYELYLVQGFYSLLLGVMYFSFRANFREMSRYIRLGDLDFILLKPCDSQFLVSVGRFILYQFSRILLGLFLIIFALHILRIKPTILQLILLIPLLFSSLTIIYSLWFFISTLTIWFVDLFNLDELFLQLTGVTRYPLEVFKYISEFLLYITLPLVVVTSVPAQLLLNKLNLSLAVWSIILSSSLFFMTRKFWYFALKYYTSASS